MSTQELALRLMVGGWARNNGDRMVEAVFEGERDKVEEMIKFCHRGPIGARVNDVDVEWQDYKGEFTNFEIRHRWIS